MEIRKLNTLRGIAVLIVLVSHYSGATNFLGGVLGTGAGQFGVMLFFILSGFLMSYLYASREFNGREVYKYATARAARVVPLFLVVVVLSYIFLKLEVRGILYHIPNTESLLSHLALLSGTSILWTIPAEIQFYVIFVFLWWLCNKRQNTAYIVIALIFLVLIFLDFPRPEGDIFGLRYDVALIRALPYFFMGFIFGQLYTKWKVREKQLSNIYVLSLLVIPLLYPKIFIFITGHNHEMWKDVGILFSVSFVFFLVTFLVPENNVLLSNRIGDFLGKISYSMYLLHLPVLTQIKKHAAESPGLFLIVFISATIAISYLSYLLVENPSRKALRAMASKRDRMRSFLAPPSHTTPRADPHQEVAKSVES